MTQLDSAFTAVKENNNRKPEYYNLFLNTELYIATYQTAANDDDISPILVESDGIKYLMLFDSEERLASWAKKEMAYAIVPGHKLVEMVGSDYHWALNVGTEFLKTFVPDEIQWLKTVVEKSQPQQAANQAANMGVLVRKPKNLPEDFIQALSEILQNHLAIQRAYLGQVHYAVKDSLPHLTLVLECSEALDPSTRSNLLDQSQALASQSLTDDQSFDLVVEGESNIANEIMKGIKPFYNSQR